MSGSLKRKTLRWYVDTNAWNPTRSEWIVAMRMVGNDFERDRINRFVYKKDAKHALVGRLLIRKCCEYFLGSKKFCLHHPDDRNLFGDQLVLERSEKGKPILMEIDENGNHQPYQDFQFNISHSGDYCVLAADTATKKLGIDIMKIEYSGGMCKINEFFNTMRRQFSEEEWRFIRNSQTDWGKLARFIRLWSLKESFVKAEGSGIIFPLSKISFECRSELVAPSQKNRFDSIVKINNRYSKYWSFEESMIDPRHYVSVARLRYTKNFDNKTDDVDRNPIDDDDDYEDDGDDDDGMVI
ncbi:hypothetical protein NH340_JMT02637 [Sarcoptes scabiei]|nr:hypothetical protein NH340_JMT02637 [Sarcoptes scabiei]